MIRPASLPCRPLHQDAGPGVEGLPRDRSPQAVVYPGKAEILACLPPELLQFSSLRAWGSLGMSLGLSLLADGLGTRIPLEPSAAPLWWLHAVVTGTVAGGCWVVAHECGHHAFHPNRGVKAVVGFLLHSLLLVP